MTSSRKELRNKKDLWGRECNIIIWLVLRYVKPSAMAWAYPGLVWLVFVPSDQCFWSCIHEIHWVISWNSYLGGKETAYVRSCNVINMDTSLCTLSSTILSFTLILAVLLFCKLWVTTVHFLLRTIFFWVLSS